MEGGTCCSGSGGSKSCPVTWLASALVVIGALNWGLYGFFEFNLVTYLLGQWPLAEKIVYDVVGLSAIFLVVKCMMKGCCNKEAKM